MVQKMIEAVPFIVGLGLTVWVHISLLRAIIRYLKS
jgi:hypothetical protein